VKRSWLSAAEVELEPVLSAHDNSLAPLLQAREAAQILGISTRSIFRLTRLAPGDPDRLPKVRIGARVLFRPADLGRYVQEHLT
jgi:hypothetical protein